MATCKSLLALCAKGVFVPDGGFVAGQATGVCDIFMRGVGASLLRRCTTHCWCNVCNVVGF